MLEDAVTVKRILVVDSQRTDTNRLARELPREEYAITTVDSLAEAESLLNRLEYDAALIAIDPPQYRTLGLLHKIRRDYPMTKVIMMTDYGDEELWVDVVNQGAADLLAKPVLGRDVARAL